MTMEQYKVFFQVAKSKSISKAAKTLFVSQPAVTKAIKTLEGELDVILFIRNSKGVVLTREGEILLNYVSEAFTQIEQGEKRLKQLKDNEFGTVRIGISTILCKHYFMPYLKLFHATYPKLKIEVVNRTSPQTLELLEVNRIDCAIISDTGDKTPYDYYHLLYIDDTFVSKDKPPKEVMSVSDLAKYPLLLLEKNNATREAYDNYFIENHKEIYPDIEISSMEFLVEFAKIGLGVSGVIRNFVRSELRDNKLYEWNVEPKMKKRSIGILYKKDEPLSIASKTFIEFMITQNVR